MCLWSPGVEFLGQRLLAWTLAERQCCQAVLGEHEQLAPLVRADVLCHYLALVQQAQLITIGAG